MTKLPARLPFVLSGRQAGSPETYTSKDIAYDVAVNGMPFLLGINPERPMRRELAELRKEQFDNQEIPGEQSLADWWLRSQATFVGGAGLLYQDPDASNRYAIQYGASAGVNPWTNGRLSLLHRTVEDIEDASSNRHHAIGWSDGTDRYWSGVGNVLRSSDGTTTTAVTWGGSGTILSLASDGTRYYAADSTGIYSGTGAGAGSLLWNTGSSSVVLGWVKGRLIAGIGASVYELVGSGAPTLPAPKFTHLAAGWTWTAVAEGTNAIYISGYAGSQSSIYKFVLDTDGAVPTLSSGGVQTAQLPHGEIVLAMSTYLGSYIGIGTSRGFRVGEIDDGGDIIYGPLIVETPCRAIVGYDRFFFVGAENAINGASGLYRVDLGQPVQNEGISPSVRYAWATDLQAHASGAVDSVTLLGNSDRLVFTVRGQGSYVEHGQELEPIGTFSTGRIRYNTLTDKIYKHLTVRAEAPIRGFLTASVTDPTGGETTVLTVSGSRAIENALIRAPITTAEWLQVNLQLSRDQVDPTAGPVVTGWQTKALPGEIRQRVFTIPLLAFDVEADRHGQQHGFEGRTLPRLEALEAACQRGDVVTLQDLRSNTSHQVLVDRYEFLQTSPPAGCAGFGGHIYLQVRTITDAVT